MRILESLSWDEIKEALGARTLGGATCAPRGASIDTRTLDAGDIFFALKGERVDGHEHVKGAFAKGASCAVVQDPACVPPLSSALVVEDTADALFELARLIRSRSRAAFVAITGSAGKTTAKDFTAVLLGARGPVLSTRGNLNNHLGVPLTMSRLETVHWAAVLECGMSHAGEISRLVNLIRPKVAAITNVAAVHLEFFNSVADIAAAKAEVFETLGTEGAAVAPANEPFLEERARASGGSVRLFGEGPRSSIRALDVSMSLDGSRFLLEGAGSRASTPISLPVPGPHAIANFLVAAAISEALEIPAETIAACASLLKPSSHRGVVRRLQDDILVIDDSYNSNPRGLLSAVETLTLARDRRRVACIGDMLELGPSGPRLHGESGQAIAPHINLLLGVGPLGAFVVAGATSLAPDQRRAFSDSAELAAEIGALVRSGDAVLVKGSRGVRMERVIEALMAAHPEVAA